MNTAYVMTQPALLGDHGTPRIAFNPYLETSLCSNPQVYCQGAACTA